MLEKLKEHLGTIIPLSEEEFTAVLSLFRIEVFPDGTKITDIGEIEKKLYFVIDGVLRLYCLNQKFSEVTVFLFSENHFASCYQSFLTGQPSDQALEAVVQSTVLSIDKAEFDRLHESFPRINIITRYIAEQRFINSQKIFSSHISKTPEERYLDFERVHGNLMLRVPQHIIASFLGVTPVSLSRIRKRVLRK